VSTTSAPPAVPAAPPPGQQVRELARAAAAPLACAALLIALLSGWVLSGGAGTITRVRIQVTLAAIPLPSFSSAAAAGRPALAYLEIHNLAGTPDELLSARTPAAAQVTLTRHGATPVAAVPALPVPAHGTLTLDPFGPDLVLTDPRGLTAGATIPLTLDFRHAGRVTVQALVTEPGAP
jgi:copper(I)-binding protein